MKSLLFTLLCFLTLGQTSYAQKLFTTKSNVELFTNTSESISESVVGIESDHDAKAPSSSIDRSELISTINVSAAGVKAMARQSEDAKQITADLLTKFQMHEWEYINNLAAEKNGSGYFAFKSGDSQSLIMYTNTLYTIKNKLKENFYRIAPGLEDADENLELLQQFNKTYSKFAKLLESRFVEL